MSSFVVSFIFECPQCHQQIDKQNKGRIVTETCGHSKCRNCFIKEEFGCVKCLTLQSPCGKDGNNGLGNEETEEERVECSNQLSDGIDKYSNHLKDIQVLEELVIHLPQTERIRKKRIIHLPQKKKIKTFKYPSHLSWQTVNGKTEFECKICNKTFRSKSNRKYHLYCDKSVEKPFSCARCAKKFATKNHLKYHEDGHEQIKHICKECDRSFMSLVSLRKHMKIHSGDFKFICDICDKKFFNKSELILHMYKHNKLPLPFHCDICNKSFSAKFKLNQHLATHKGVKSYSCELCGKKFARKSTLSMHVLIHLNTETKYECKACLKSFERQRSYARHMKIKHGSTLFRCPLCGVKSGRKDNILRHIRNLHSDENFDEIVIKITKNLVRHKVIKRPETPSGKVDNLHFADNQSTKECIVTQPPTDCQYQSVIKFAQRSQTPSQSQPSVNIDEVDKECANDISIPAAACVNHTLTVPKQFNNELRIELTEPTEPADPKISNINIYRQLLSPYLKPPPNLDLRNGIRDQYSDTGFRKSQHAGLLLRKDNVDIYRSILMSTDVEQDTVICDKSIVSQKTAKISNNKTESLVIHGQSKEYFAEMHWRKRTSQCFSQMELEQ